MSSILALIISSSSMQSPPIPKVITEAIEIGSNRTMSLFIDRVDDVSETVATKNSSKSSTSLDLCNS